MGYLGNQITTVFPTSISVDSATISGNTTVGGTLGVTGVSTLSDNIVFGASGKGVHLGVTSATASNLLEDYEEGSFTATMSNSVTLDSNFQTLHYTKIGRQVHIHGNLRVLNSNGGSALVVNNLPFTSQNATNAISTTTTLSLSNFNVPMVTSGTNDTVDFYGELGVNSTALHFFQSRDNNNTIVLGGDNDGFFTFGITYFTA